MRTPVADLLSDQSPIHSAEVWPPPATRYDRLVIEVARGHSYGDLLEVCLGR